MLVKVSEGQCWSCASLRLWYEAEGLTAHSCSLQHHKEVEQADKAEPAIQMVPLWYLDHCFYTMLLLYK